MSPYISENGNFCKYDVNERKIIEIKKIEMKERMINNDKNRNSTLWSIT